MREEHRTQRIRRRFALGLGALLYTPLLFWAAFAPLFRARGWRFTLTAVSVAGNILFLVVVILAYTVSLGPSAKKECPSGPNDVLPPGFVCKEQGPLYFAEMSPEELAYSVLPRTIDVFLRGCIVASFEFAKGVDTLSGAELYDANCRPRVDLDPATGATSYSVYDGYTDPEYSVRDKDGDGIPDLKIDWTSNTSFRRTEPIEWHAMNECKEVDGEQGIMLQQKSP